MATNLGKDGFLGSLLQNLVNLFQRAEQRLLDIELRIKSTGGEVTESVLAEQQRIFNADITPYVISHMKHHAPLSIHERDAEGVVFRNTLKSYLDQAPLVARCLARPRGYPGDSEMMRMLYDDRWEGQSLFGKILHRYFTGYCPLSEAVRNRRTLIASELLGFGAQRENKHTDTTLDIMSVACGPAQEVADLIASKAAGLRFTLLDQDLHAIQEAKQAVSTAQEQFGADCPTRFVQKSIGVFLKPRALDQMRSQLGEFDFIYSMGLYDYLDAKTARTLTTSLLTLLRPGGVLLLGNFRDTEWTGCLECWADWPLVYRTEDTLREVVDPRLVDDVKIDAEPSGCQLFLKATRTGVDRLDVGPTTAARL